MSKIILITGCSTGIGRDLAQRLAHSGYTVVATARKTETLDEIEVALKLPLDVTQEDSIKQTIECINQRFGRIDVLVNNAGYSQIGAIEELAGDRVKQMYDVNVFGAMRMIRAVVPYTREQKVGQIINISSIAGKMVTLVNGTYSSTKFALEAISDALRLELEPFNIQVILVEPGAIKTNFDKIMHDYGDEILSNPTSPYLPLYRKYDQVSDEIRRRKPGPEAVSKVVQQAIESSKPKARYLSGVPFVTGLVIHLGDPVWNLVVKRMYKITTQE